MTKRKKSSKQSYGGTRRGKRSKNGNSKKLDTIKDSKESEKNTTDGGHPGTPFLSRPRAATAASSHGPCTPSPWNR